MKSSLSAQLPNPNHAFSTEYRRSSIKPNIFIPRSQKYSIPPSASSNSVTSKDYRDSASKFQAAKALIEKESFENIQRSYCSRPSLIVQAKEDELRALMALRQRENQQQMVEILKNNEKLLAEQQVLTYQKKQIKEKVDLMNKMKNDDYDYARKVDDRVRFMNRVELDEYEMREKKKAEYKQGLMKQFQEKDQEKIYLQKIRQDMKIVLTPEPESRNSPVSPYSRCISPQTPGKSSLKFLAQYGNLIMNKK